MASPHGRKPPNPKYVPKSHGKKPRAPKPHSNSGSSSTGTRTMAIAAIVIFGVPFLAFLSAVGYVVKGYLS